MSEAKMDASNYKVIADINPKQFREWEAHILENYPEYRMLPRHDINDDQPFSQMLTDHRR
jgi:hypothetical protein